MRKLQLLQTSIFGARNDSINFLDYYEKFYKETFFPRIKEEKVDAVLMLGDTFDRRKYLNFYTLKRTKEMFFEPLAYMDMDVHILAGNHDTYFKNNTLLIGSNAPTSANTVITDLSANNLQIHHTIKQCQG